MEGVAEWSRRWAASAAGAPAGWRALSPSTHPGCARATGRRSVDGVCDRDRGVWPGNGCVAAPGRGGRAARATVIADSGHKAAPVRSWNRMR